MAPSKAALLVVDVQQGFDHPSWGPRNNPEAEKKIAFLLSKWREHQNPIFHIHHSSQSPKGHFNHTLPGHKPKQEAIPLSSERIIVKNVNSAFIGTKLENQLRSLQIDTICIVGLTTNHCISTTARMAGNLGFITFVVEDATATFDRANLDGTMRPAIEVHQSALSDLSEEFAEIISTEQAVDKLLIS